MRRLPSLLPLAACAVLAACGGGGGGNGEQAASSGAPATVSARSVDGVGTVLVDPHGAALYTPEQEADGQIRCTGSCTSIWAPLVPGAGPPTAGKDVGGKLAVIARADGSRQVSYGGKPLYTFTQDPGPGKVTGNGAKDSFGGTAFTWHAVTTKGAAPAKKSSDKQRTYGAY